MSRINYFNLIEEQLSLMAFRITNRAKFNLLELNSHAEISYLNLFNELFGWKLQKINPQVQNTKAVDLIDHTNKYIIQVSSTATKKKIEDSLAKLSNDSYNGYSFKFISISKDAKKLRLKEYINPYKIAFNPKSDIYDINSILASILILNIKKQRQIYNLINLEFMSNNNARQKANNYKNEGNEEIEKASFLPIVMAGGLGKRVLHLSPDGTPKQFWKLYGRDSMLQDIVSRLTSFEHDNKLKVRVVSVVDLKNSIINQNNKQIQGGLVDLWFEPERKGTTKAIAYSIMRALEEKIVSEHSIVGFFPADQYIFDQVKEGTKSGLIAAENKFHKTIRKAIDAAKKNESIVLVGTPARRAESESTPGSHYGWIKVLDDKAELMEADIFIEKPGPDKIKNMLESQINHFWNSGIFIGRVSVFRKSMLHFLPDVFNQIQLSKSSEVSDFVCTYEENSEYRMFDEAVLEKIAGKKQLDTKVHVIKATYAWEDLGHLCTIIEHFRRRKKFTNKSAQAALGEIQIQFFDFNDADTTYVVHENDGDIQIASLNIIKKLYN